MDTTVAFLFVLVFAAIGFVLDVIGAVVLSRQPEKSEEDDSA